MTDYIEFQDRSFPLAYFLSFRAYGTWLHGDERLSMNRKDFNGYGSGKIPVNSALKEKEFSNLKNSPVYFDSQVRDIIKSSIAEVCQFRKYHLISINVRTNHIHCVVSGNCKPELILNSFKSYATRHLREKKIVSKDLKIWSRHGSTRYLWNENQVAAANDYVLNGQGEEIPDFNQVNVVDGKLLTTA